MSDKLSSSADYLKNEAATVAEPSRLWPQTEIEENLWDQYRPYQLLLVQVSGTSDKPTYKQLGNFKYTLPISPQDLSIDMPIMTNVQATLGGISEIHGGAPFRNITLAGTTGIAPLRGKAKSGISADGPNEFTKVGSAVFAGTVSAVNRGIEGVKSAISGGTVKSPNLHSQKPGSEEGLPAGSTGYYQYLMLQKFIENYVQIKSKSQTLTDLGVHSNDIRLALAIHKESAIYLCSGVQLTRRKSASDPHLVNFTLQLKAWARVKVDGANSPAVYEHTFTARQPNEMAKTYTRLRAARDTIDALDDALHSIVTDATSTVGEALRTTSLFVKSAAGLPHTPGDFSSIIQRACEQDIIRNWTTLRKQFEGDIPASFDDHLLRVKESDAGKVFAGKEAHQYANGGVPQGYKDEASTFSSGNTGTKGKGGLRKSIENILNKVPLSSLKLDANTRKSISQEIKTVGKLSRFDFEVMRDQLRHIADKFAYAIGGGNAAYTATYGGLVETTARTPTNTEFEVLFALNESAQVLDALAASSKVDPVTPTTLEYVAGLAEQSGIAFKVPRSKFPVPFPYGTTLERLSAQYLGDANRWHEIATLNGLRAPYVDEEGFSLPLLVNGDRHQVVVADASDLFIGQSVWLSANGIRRIKRRIGNIEEVSPGNNVVSLDGDPDLQLFTVLAQSKLEAFLPGTVNSQQIIYIPSSNEAGQDPQLKAVPGVDAFDPLLQVGGMDLLLTPDGDLVITPDGDCKIAFGLANIVQTVRLAFATNRGALLQHPDYGLNVPAGTSLADFSASQLLTATREFFANDPSFSEVRSASVVQNGNTVTLSVEVRIAGTSQYIQVSVDALR